MANSTSSDSNKHGQGENVRNFENNSSITSDGKLVVKTTVNRDSLYYDMSRGKGFAYIFSHENFLSNASQKREAADIEAKKMKGCLENLGFNVQPIFKDLKVKEIEYHIQQARDMDHKDHNCFVTVVMSHGEKDLISASDRCYDPNKVLWNQFTADKCPSLAGKPKLFFIQCCRGNNIDPGMTMRCMRKTETDGVDDYKIPISSDFCIMYSTARDYFSFCNDRKGSIFINTLCDELNKHAYHEHLLTILTFVIRRVAIEFQSRSKTLERHMKKQAPNFESSLTRLLQFVDKGDKQRKTS